MGPAAQRKTPRGFTPDSDAAAARRAHLLQEMEGTDTPAAATHPSGCRGAVGDHGHRAAGSQPADLTWRCVTRMGRGRESHASQPSTRLDSHSPANAPISSKINLKNLPETPPWRYSRKKRRGRAEVSPRAQRRPPPAQQCRAGPEAGPRTAGSGTRRVSVLRKR